MSKTVKKSSSKKKPSTGKKVVKAKKAAVPVKKEKKSATKKAAKKSASAPKGSIGTKKAIAKKSPAKSVATKVAIKKAVTKKSAVKKPGLTKSTVKKAIEKKTRLAGGIIVKDIAVKKAAVPEKPRSPLLNAIIEGLEERKAKNIVVIDLHNIQNRSFDHFVIADADSSTHVEAIASAVEEEVKKKIGERPYHSEGWQNAEWILLDYIDVVVHVFQRPIREFYNIEDLWADAEIQKIN